MSGPCPADPEPRPRAGWAHRSLSVPGARAPARQCVTAAPRPRPRPRSRRGSCLLGGTEPALRSDWVCGPRPGGKRGVSKLGGARLPGARRRSVRFIGRWGVPDLGQSSLSQGGRAEPSRGATCPSAAAAQSRACRGHFAQRRKRILERSWALYGVQAAPSLRVAFRGGPSSGFFFFAPVYFYFPGI